MVKKIMVGITLTSDQTQELEQGLGKIFLSYEEKETVYISFRLLQPKENITGFELKEGDTVLFNTTGKGMSPADANLLPLRTIAIGKICLWAIMNVLNDSILPKVPGGETEDIMIVRGPTNTTFPYQYEWEGTAYEAAIIFVKQN